MCGGGAAEGRTHALRGAVKVFLQFFRPPVPGYARVVHYGV